jgi:beta-N-acetylhexosaminidase
MRQGISPRALMALLSVGAHLGSAGPPSEATGPNAPTNAEPLSGGPRHSADAQLRGQLIGMLHDMTLEQKVGQLFVVEVYGQDAVAVTPPAAARNQAFYGVRTPAQVIDKYKHGGVIYYDARRGPEPAQPAADRHVVQRTSVGRDQPATADPTAHLHRPGGSLVFRLPAPATAMPGNMALGAGRSAEDAHRSAEVIGSELASVGINQRS